MSFLVIVPSSGVVMAIVAIMTLMTQQIAKVLPRWISPVQFVHFPNFMQDLENNEREEERKEKWRWTTVGRAQNMGRNPRQIGWGLFRGQASCFLTASP
jgi:hypothetical protein